MRDSVREDDPPYCRDMRTCMRRTDSPCSSTLPSSPASPSDTLGIHRLLKSNHTTAEPRVLCVLRPVSQNKNMLTYIYHATSSPLWACSILYVYLVNRGNASRSLLIISFFAGLCKIQNFKKNV